MRLFASWVVSALRKVTSVTIRPGCWLRHLFRYAPDKIDRLLRGQGILKQEFEIIPVRDPEIVALDHAGELAPAGVDIEQVRQPSVELQQGERAVQPSMRASLERDDPHCHQVILLCLTSYLTELVRHEGRIFSDSDVPANYCFVHYVVLATSDQ